MILNANIVRIFILYALPKMNYLINYPLFIPDIIALNDILFVNTDNILIRYSFMS